MKKLLIMGVMAGVLGAWNLTADDAQALWDKDCAKCHGQDGSGDTAMGKRFKLKDYREASVQAAFTDEQAAAAIKDGVKEDGKTKMKGFGDKLSDDQIKALVAHVRSLKK